MESERCNICRKNGQNLMRIEEIAGDNVKYRVKLADCVPEIIWDENYIICLPCRGKIDAVYDFKQLCLQSLLFRDYDNYFSENKDLTNSDDEIITKTSVGDEKFICYHCDGSFMCKGDITDHIKSEHNPLQPRRTDDHKIGAVKKKKSKRYECPNCLKLYMTEKILKVHHLKCATGEKKAANVCLICNSEFLTKYLLTRHLRNVHATEKIYNCDVCEQKFASRVYLTAHKRYHVGDRPYICPTCGKGFITKSDLYHHEKIHANLRDYKCQLCPKAFNTSSDLHKHKMCVHSDRSNWKYVCQFCNKRFPLKTNLDSHTKTHTGEKNFACHLCDRKCINRSVLQRHVESHSNVRSFKCDVCKKDYKYRKSLDLHLTKAHGIGNTKIPERVKKYFCHICPKAYYANNKLQKHIRSHTGERPFQCLTCGKRFIDQSYIKQHMKVAHNVQLEKAN